MQRLNFMVDYLQRATPPLMSLVFMNRRFLNLLEPVRPFTPMPERKKRLLFIDSSVEMLTVEKVNRGPLANQKDVSKVLVKFLLLLRPPRTSWSRLMTVGLTPTQQVMKTLGVGSA